MAMPCVVLPTMFNEHEATPNVLTRRTFECVMLEAEKSHCIVLIHLHEDHFAAAHHTLHRTYS